MRKYILLMFIMIVLCGNAFSYAQDSTSSQYPFEDGLNLQSGIGYLALRDEYISGDKYSSTIPLFALSWSKWHETYGFRLQLESQYTNDLKGPNVSAELAQVRLGLDYLYPFANMEMSSKTVHFFMGPTLEVFEHYQLNQIAGSEFLNSNISLVAGDLRLEAFCPLTGGLLLLAMAQCTALSMGVHSTNLNEGGSSPIKILTPLKGLDAEWQIGLSWLFAKSFGLSAGYRFDLTRVSAWDYFISADDNFIVSLAYAL